jgi:hypothetical protein
MWNNNLGQKKKFQMKEVRPWTKTFTRVSTEEEAILLWAGGQKA